MTSQDRIEREITVNAPIDQVWPLVAQPGWWIGRDPSGQCTRQEGDTWVVESPDCGTYPVRTEGIEPGRYAAYRWATTSGQEPREGNSTLVEFWLSELAEGSTLVRVVESGFAGLGVPEDERRHTVDSHTQGWHEQLDNLRARAEHVAV